MGKVYVPKFVQWQEYSYLFTQSTSIAEGNTESKLELESCRHND